MNDIAPIIAIALAPLAYWLIRKLLTAIRWLCNKVLPEGRIKKLLMKEY